jgi:hypothetical protein
MPNHKFLWAVARQLSILDDGDAPLIETIQNDRRPPNQLVEHFLKGYKLWRFGGFKSHPRSLDAFIDIAERLFRPKPADSIAASRTWLSAVSEFKGRSHLGLQYSAFLKFYWFYQPRMLTIYDQYTLKGLRVAEKQLGIQSRPSLIKPENFLNRFDAVYKRHVHDIREAVSMFNRHYPYERRVLDKYLWLLGNRTDEQKRLLTAFMASLRLAPLHGSTK